MQDTLFGIENSLKVFKGWLVTFPDENFMQRKQNDYSAPRDWIAADPARFAKYEDPWAELAKTQRRCQEVQDRYNMIRGGAGKDAMQLFACGAPKPVLATSNKTTLTTPFECSLVAPARP